MNGDSITRVGVVGAGLMGHAIALQFALRGCEVMLNDLDDQRLAQAMENMEVNLALLRELGLASDEDARDTPSRVHTSASLEEGMGNVDFVVEAVFEDLPLKLRVFEELDRCCPSRTVLTSNTSSFMTSQLAPATKRPDRVLVANWWNPPHLLPLIEVVKGPATSDEALEITTGLFTRIGKRPVVLEKESLGFIGNRMQFALLREALAIVAQGIASPEDVDAVVTSSFGRRLAVAGPLEVFDMAGWDTILHIIDQLFPVIESSGQAPALIENMVERGDLGVKSGKGFYTWDEDSTAALRQRVGRALATIDQIS